MKILFVLYHINIFDLIFIDIETVPQFPEHGHLNDSMKDLWKAKHSFLKSDDTAEDSYLTRAGV